MKVSVVLPVYNGANTIAQTLDSLATQTYMDFELLACIDGTTDASKEIIESYRNHFKAIRIIENIENRGLGSTMNRLVYESKGDYIAIAEQDDYYYPERLALQVEVLNTNPEVGMVSGIAEFWNGKEVTAKFPGILVHGGVYPEGESMFLLNYRNQIKVVNSCMMFRRKAHIDNGLYFSQHYPSVGVDWAYVLRFSLVSKIYGLQHLLVRIDRRSSRNSVTNNKGQQFKASRELIRSFAYEYPEIILKEDYQYAICMQLALETNHLSGLKFILQSLKYIIIYPKCKRFRQSFVKRFKRKFSK
ncbi:MAG: glycosyltransferase family 2 protein [Flavobacteriales bacterium]